MLEQRNEDVTEIKQQALIALIGEISKKSHLAGWYDGVEFCIWRAIDKGYNNFGMKTCPQEYLDKAKALAEELGGWMIWKVDEDYPEREAPAFIDMESWTKEYRRKFNEDIHDDEF